MERRNVFEDFVEYRRKIYNYWTTFDSFYFIGKEKDCGKIKSPHALFPVYSKVRGAAPYNYTYIIPVLKGRDAYFNSLGKRTKKNIRQMRRRFNSVKVMSSVPNKKSFSSFSERYDRYTDLLDKRDEEYMDEDYEVEYEEDIDNFISYWTSKIPKLRRHQVFGDDELLYTAYSIRIKKNTISIPLVLKEKDNFGTLGLFEIIYSLADKARYIDLCETYSPYKVHLGAWKYQTYLYVKADDKKTKDVITRCILKEAKKNEIYEARDDYEVLKKID